MNDAEWEIVTGVYNSSNLPFKQRIFVTDGLGGDNAPFTIPTSLISSLPAVLATALGGAVLGGPAGAALAAAVGSGAASLASFVNAAYIMNVGPNAYTDMSVDYPDLATPNRYRDLLVHETCHVWQGKNSTFALSYVFGSAYNQCKGILSGASRNAAYNYRPLGDWGSYNPEQQAKLVEDWYDAGEHGSGDLWPYIRDFVRKGTVS
jgi:hypothetical protein